MRESIPGPVSKAGTVPTKMGSWSTIKPVLEGKCNFCLLCWIFCPEGAISQDEADRKVLFDHDYCKGCGICAKECPTKAIQMAEPEAGRAG
ncbi:MAG TPA: 4Fe-4S binding protein [Dehalococcoidia bacterium]|jgi:2-oxoacid:acceptor oxidoreductase delta subunit (pyruvate/2-ketoisovalerate family)|nr:4Fe-4S binding protein [Dehalococcoidia bacterium]